MKRKLIGQGSGGITMSLPINWVREHNLSAGDEINVEEYDGDLVVSGLGFGAKTKELHFDNPPKELLRTIISSLYRQGYSELKLVFQEAQPFEDIQKIVNSLLGYELVFQGKNECVIKDIMGVNREETSALICKLFQKVNLFYDMILERDAGAKHTKDDFESLRHSILKLRDYAQRVILLERANNAHELYSLVLAVEKIAGEYYHLANAKIKMTKAVREVLEDYHGLFKRAYKLYLKKDFVLANRFYNKVQKKSFADFKDADYTEVLRTSGQGAALICNTILHNLLTVASRLLAVSAHA